MNIHFWAPYRMIKTVLPIMRGVGAGRIVNIASIGGKVAVPHLTRTARANSRSSVIERLAARTRQGKLFVTTVCPGLMRTAVTSTPTLKDKTKRNTRFSPSATRCPFLRSAPNQPRGRSCAPHGAPTPKRSFRRRRDRR
jgi:NAD(P)-dependent dehydrogenase (short-subunit alcohol dehydrogenase family)